MVRYAADNDQRSSKYDDLLAAEDKALKSKKGERYCLYSDRLNSTVKLRGIKLFMIVFMIKIFVNYF